MQGELEIQAQPRSPQAALQGPHPSQQPTFWEEIIRAQVSHMVTGCFLADSGGRSRRALPPPSGSEAESGIPRFLARKSRRKPPAHSLVNHPPSPRSPLPQAGKWEVGLPVSLGWAGAGGQLL